MTYEEFYGYSVLFALAAGLGTLVFVLVWLPMARLLGANSRLQQAKPFFVRTLILVMLLGAVGPVVGEGLNLPETAAPMEYIWQAAGELESSFLAVGLYLFGYVVIMTILAATLGKYRDE